jgi:hypothetical protein
VNPKKIMDMNDWPCPKAMKTLCGFLGMTSYYRKFVNIYGEIMSPLTTLLKDNDFVWNDTIEKVFHYLKEYMVVLLYH